jgi:Asp-tRNA(Asn)/Glu-tRNA(Gln) amidotransferase A subunit family amidase
LPHRVAGLEGIETVPWVAMHIASRHERSCDSSGWPKAFFVGEVSCVPPVNLLGLPAAVVPAGEAGGVPVGVQLIGPAWREDVCLAAANTIETARGAVLPIDPR